MCFENENSIADISRFDALMAPVDDTLEPDSHNNPVLDSRKILVFERYGTDAEDQVDSAHGDKENTKAGAMVFENAAKLRAFLPLRTMQLYSYCCKDSKSS